MIVNDSCKDEMAKNQREKLKKPGERKPLIASMSRWKNNYGIELKLIFIILLFLLGFILTAFQFLPTRLLPHSSDYAAISCPTTTATPPPQPPSAEILENGTVLRSFYPVGTAAYNFVLMSAYRGGPHTFAVIGLSSKPLHTFGKPTYKCEYQYPNSTNITTRGEKLSFQDFGYARVYVVIVVNCTFPHETDPTSGGRLLLHASTNGGYDRAVHSTDTIVALNEPQNSWEPSQFLSPPKYDYLYCGSSLFGNLSPQRVREWISYHVKFFGTRSHFVIHDAGGVHPEVFEVLKPWIELGFVTVEDIKDQERFDAFYHNQMLVINDCLHRYRFATKWMFFFDLDEYLYLPEKSTLQSVVDQVKDYTLFVIDQVSMSNQLCLSEDATQISKYVCFLSLFVLGVLICLFCLGNC
ncbi:Galactan beta-1 4-galactosyltransferase GALS3 [Bienertia sinuspersici]